MSTPTTLGVGRPPASTPRPADRPHRPAASRPILVAALVLAVVALIGSVLLAPRLTARSAGPAWTGYGDDAGAGHMGGIGMMDSGPGMMSGQVWLAGDGVPVTSISSARARAAQASSSQGLHPGEVIWFRNGFYVELKDTSGASVTEVIVHPRTGAVSTEPGPATMWNTGTRTAAISEDRARSIATVWLRDNRPAESVSSVDAYPGYYTLDTQAAGTPTAMLSVNATTGAVWYHTWHGSFVAEEDS